MNDPKRTPRPGPAPEAFRTRLASLTSRGRDIANQLVDLYRSARSERDREFVIESATEIRLILMQPDSEWHRIPLTHIYPIRRNLLRRGEFRQSRG